MATIEEMQSKMTIFFSKRTGDLKEVLGGIQDMNIYGKDKEDYELIRDFVVLDRDNYVLDKPNNFIYDIEENQLKIKQDAIPKYPVA
ncbi:hypothetical protein CSC2_22760 [Clostridium zeae]|uniref:Uncharacterized protein n=1 Tax=Clostridium zeae TaxID=2759022 RepID=A0ABQ1EAE7_9CLOT|nr:hypothetical protein [Clostridium zeae]GFZ31750.1 hypothetical protein CSC2_22760 [Clostridium zeae]